MNRNQNSPWTSAGSVLTPAPRAGCHMIPTSQVRKLSPREVESLAQGVTPKALFSCPQGATRAPSMTAGDFSRVSSCTPLPPSHMRTRTQRGEHLLAVLQLLSRKGQHLSPAPLPPAPGFFLKAREPQTSLVWHNLPRVGLARGPPGSFYILHLFLNGLPF